MIALGTRISAGLGLPGGPMMLFALALTIGAYLAGVALQRRTRLEVLNPVLVAIVIVGGALHVLHISYATYFAGAQALHFLLGPATVALAIPMVRSLELLRRDVWPLLAALAAGAITAMVSGYGLVRLCGGSQVLALTMLPKSLTTPIALEVSLKLGGIPALTAVLAILAGVLVAGVLSDTMKWFKISDPASIGLAAGAAGSGIGTSRAIGMHPQAGAFAAVAVGLNGLITAALAPWLAALLQRGW